MDINTTLRDNQPTTINDYQDITKFLLKTISELKLTIDCLEIERKRILKNE